MVLPSTRQKWFTAAVVPLASVSFYLFSSSSFSSPLWSSAPPSASSYSPWSESASSFAGDDHNHSASVIPDPPSYFRTGNSDQAARRQWAKTLQWRSENGIDTILSEPPPHFDLINQFVPTSIHGRDKRGNLVSIEKWGSVDMAALRRHGLTNDDYLRQYMFQIEYLWAVAAPKEHEKVTLIMDIQNVTFDQLTPSVVSFVQKRVGIGCNHYPNRGAHLIVVNIPSWWQYGWALVQNLLSAEVSCPSVAYQTDRIGVAMMVLDNLRCREIRPLWCYTTVLLSFFK